MVVTIATKTLNVNVSQTDRIGIGNFLGHSIQL